MESLQSMSPHPIKPTAGVYNFSVIFRFSADVWCGSVYFADSVRAFLQVYIDKSKVDGGSLYDDFDMLAPKTIKVKHLTKFLIAAGTFLLLHCSLLCVHNCFNDLMKET
jgi:hypothetical protein